MAYVVWICPKRSAPVQMRCSDHTHLHCAGRMAVASLSRAPGSTVSALINAGNAILAMPRVAGTGKGGGAEPPDRSRESAQAVLAYTPGRFGGSVSYRLLLDDLRSS